MPPMKEKIKNFFGFIGRAWSGGLRGKAGIILAIFATMTFIGLFRGDVSIQKFAMNVWYQNQEQQQLDIERAKLNALNRHIELLQGYSADYVEELGLKYLNIGDPKTKILKI